MVLLHLSLSWWACLMLCLEFRSQKVIAVTSWAPQATSHHTGHHDGVWVRLCYSFYLTSKSISKSWHHANSKKNESFYVVLVEPSWRNQQASSSAAAARLAQQWLTVKTFGESYKVLADVFSTTSWRFALLICIGDEQTKLKQSIFRRCRPRRGHSIKIFKCALDGINLEWNGRRPLFSSMALDSSKHLQSMSQSSIYLDRKL